MTWLVRFILLICFAATAAAEEAKSYLPQKPAYQVMVVGDSLSAGLWSGLARMTESDLRFSVDGRYKEDSGLARLDFYDWTVALPKILDVRPADIVVIMLGSNDPQSIRDGDLRHAFGTPDWVKAYEARIDGLLAMLKARGVAVYWVSPPPMASAKYHDSIRQIAAIQKGRVVAAGVRYVDIRPPLSNLDGSYTDRGLDETGADRRLRSKDGVHFLKSGNSRIGALTLEAIRADIAGEAEIAAPALAQSPASDGEEEGPLFGQEPASGVNNIVKAEALKPETGKRAEALVSAPATIVAGSSAARLFSSGEPLPAPKGRFDDFSAPATP